MFRLYDSVRQQGLFSDPGNNCITSIVAVNEQCEVSTRLKDKG